MAALGPLTTLTYCSVIRGANALKLRWSAVCPRQAGQSISCLWSLWLLLLQGEHGTGRNMAPFVEVEWGRQATAIMQRIKNAFDPQNLLNPGVILNPVGAVSTGVADRLQTHACTTLVFYMLLELCLCQIVLPDSPKQVLKPQ